MTTVRTGPQPADFADVRATNLAVVLRQVRVAAPCSRADIAAATGLTKATVSSLVAELIDRRILRETGLTENRIGRPATMLVIDGSSYVGIGIEIGADHLSTVAVDLAGRRVLSWRRSSVATGGPAGRLVAEVAGLARRAAARVQGAGGNPVGLHVAVPGRVDAAGVVRSAPALGWIDVDLRARLVRMLGSPDYPVGVDDNATLGAVAEYRYGAVAGAGHLLYLAGPPGSGVGVISAGAPMRGSRGYGATIGHLPVDPAGRECSCGRAGCLDTVAGLDALLRRTGTDPGEALALDLEVEQLARRADDAEEPVLRVLQDAATGLGCAVTVLVDMFDPAEVVLGGYYAPLAPWLLPPVGRALRALAAPGAGNVRVAASTLGYEAPALGGAAVALNAIDPTVAGLARPVS